MFSHNGRISTHQMVRLLVLDLFTGACLFLPRALPRVAGSGSLLAYVLGIGLTLLYGWIVSTSLAKTSSGQWIFQGRGISVTLFRLLCGLRCLGSFIFAFGLFITVLHDTFLYTMKKEWILVAMVLVLIYGGVKGLEVRARLSELFFFIVLLPILLIGMFSIPEADWTELEIQMGYGIKSVIQGALVTWVVMNPVEWALYLPVDQTHHKMGKIIGKAVIIGSLLVGAVYGLCVMVLGVDGMINEQWPTVILMQIMKIPGGFVSRQDGLMLSFWIFGMYMSLSGAVCHASELLGNGAKYKKKIMLFFVLIGAWISLRTGMNPGFLNVYFYGMIISGGIVCLSLIFRMWFSNRKKKHLKWMVLILVCIFSLSGCENYVELENRDFVMAIGVDLGTEARYRFTLTFPDLSAATGKESKEKREPLSFEANSLEEAEIYYNRMSENVLDYGQLKVLLLGKDVVSEKNNLEIVLFEMKDKPEIVRTICLCQSEQSAEEVLMVDKTLDTSVGIYLEKLFKNHHVETILNDWIGDQREKELPTVAVQGDRPGLILR